MMFAISLKKNQNKITSIPIGNWMLIRCAFSVHRMHFNELNFHFNLIILLANEKSKMKLQSKIHKDFIMVCFISISMHSWCSNTFNTVQCTHTHFLYWALCQTFSSVLINYTFGSGQDVVFLWNFFFGGRNTSIQVVGNFRFPSIAKNIKRNENTTKRDDDTPVQSLIMSYDL